MCTTLLQIGNLTSLLDLAERLLGHFFMRSRVAAARLIATARRPPGRNKKIADVAAISDNKAVSPT
jgi:hypothetical protein